jgi:hypothetical protein
MRGKDGSQHCASAALRDGDSKPEVAVSYSKEKRGDCAVSAVSTKDGTVLWTLDGTKGVSRGMDLASARDVNEDGIRDLIAVSHFTMAPGAAGKGYLRLVSGKTGEVLRMFNDLDVE